MESLVLTSIQASNVGAFARGGVGTVRQECLGWMLVWGRRHLDRVPDEYVRHDNEPATAPRPGPSSRRGLWTTTPSWCSVQDAAAVRRRDRLGGLTHEYHQAAA